LYYVAYGIFYSETEENWVWFMQQLKRAMAPHLVWSYQRMHAKVWKLLSVLCSLKQSRMQYLEQHHNWLWYPQSRLWYRCGFSEESKCDYLKNNISESFNSQIRHLKGLLLRELVDGLRELIMAKRYLRKQIASKMAEGILPNVLKELNQVSSNLRILKVARSDDDCAEVTLVDAYNNTRRH
jgi:hypothetical protein